jgi:hypothetical protein
MTDRKNWLHKAIDAVVDGRTRKARREVATYLRDRGLDTPERDPRDR